MAQTSSSTKLAQELSKEMRDALDRGKRDQEPLFMHKEMTDSEYRRMLKGMSKDGQEAELARLTPEEVRRLFPPTLGA